MTKLTRLSCLVLVLLLAVSDAAGAQDFVPVGVMARVRKIGVGPAIATAFIVEVDKRQYVITAKHVVATLGDEGEVEFYEGDGQRKKVAVKILRCNEPVDIAVLVPQTLLLPVFDPGLTQDGRITFGQDVYFIGFPYGDDKLSTHFENVALGFIRKATLSAMDKGDDWILLFLDGRNNAGFSGGPVFYRDLNEPSHPVKIIGVISGYRSAPTDVVKLEPVKDADITAEDLATNRIVVFGNGEKRRVMSTNNVVMDNTGIVHAYGIKAAYDLIRARGGPGPQVPNQPRHRRESRGVPL